MARGKGEGTIHKISNGKYQARVTTGYDDNGKQQRQAKYFKTIKEARTWLAEISVTRSKGGFVAATSMTVGEWVRIWLNEYKKDSVRIGTFQLYYEVYKVYIIPCFGNIKLKDLRAVTIQKSINDWNREKKLSTSRMTTIISSVLKPALLQAVKNDLILKNPAEGVMIPKNPSKDIRVLSQKEQNRFIEAAKMDQYGGFFIFALATGLRRGEILALTWDDIDFKEKTVSVNKTLSYCKDINDKHSKYGYIVNKPKTKLGKRIIPLLPDIVSMLENIKKQQIENPLMHKNNLVFCNGKGECIQKSVLHHCFKKILFKADIENVGIHSLRHTFATRGLENGIELKVMQEFLGHSSIKITADIYTHVLPDKKHDSMMKLVDTINI